MPSLTKIESYLTNRKLPPEDCELLRIRHLTYDQATSRTYGFSKLATSPDGVILFPFAPDGTAGAARNLYDSKESEAAHLAKINEWRKSQELEPEKHTAKYLLPTGSQSKIYDPYSILNPDSEVEPIFATEDVIGVAKAALRGIRVLSTFGVWLGTKDDLEASKEPDWRHELTGIFDEYLADSDAIENPQVAAAKIRTGFLVGVNIGCFPAMGEAKVGLDEYLDAHPHATADSLRAMLSENAKPVMDWIEMLLLNHVPWLMKRGYSDGQAVKTAGLVREAVLKEVFRHTTLQDLKVSGYYEKVFKSNGLNLADLQQKQRAVQSTESAPSIADLIIEICKAEAILFHNAEKDCFADLIVDNCRHTYRLKSPEFKRWVARRLFELHDKCLNSEAYTAARTTLESLAVFDGKEQEVYLRVAEFESKTYLDLANEKWQAIEIDSQGWRIVDRPPVRFWRPSSMLPLATPVKGGDLDQLKELLNVTDSDWVLIVCFLLFCFTASTDFPVLLLAACRGSGKTSSAEFLKSLIDPGKSPLIKVTADAHHVGIQGSRRWLLAYDNVSHISPDASDIICRVATGFGHSTRTLFETEGETSFEFSRPQIITAIDHVVTRDDLSDRLLMVQLPEIKKEKRLPKRELKAKLEALRPKLLGAIFTALSETLAILPGLEPKELPRLADFGNFSLAVEQALGFKANTFTDNFAKNRELSRQVVLEASPLAEAIELLINKEKTFKGTATELLKRLESYAEDTVIKSRAWPKSTNSLSRQLNRLKPDLAAVGILVKSDLGGTGNNRTRLIEIEAVASEF